MSEPANDERERNERRFLIFLLPSFFFYCLHASRTRFARTIAQSHNRTRNECMASIRLPSKGTRGRRSTAQSSSAVEHLAALREHANLEADARQKAPSQCEQPQKGLDARKDGWLIGRLVDGIKEGRNCEPEAGWQVNKQTKRCITGPTESIQISISLLGKC